MFKPVGSLIQQIPIRSKSSRAIVALQVRLAAQEALKAVLSDLPKEVVESAKPTIFKNGVLTLACPALLASELKMRSEGLIEEVNKSLGGKVVSRLRFRVS